MFNSRSLKHAFLASLAFLPLTACTPESLNAVTSLLKDSSLQSSQSGDLRNAQSFAEGSTRAGVKVPVSSLKPTPGAPTKHEGNSTNPPDARPMTQPDTQTDVPPSTQPAEKPEQDAGAQAVTPTVVSCGQPIARAMVRVRFGQFKLNPQSPLTGWKGSLVAEHASLKIYRNIQLEANDLVTVNAEHTQIGWKTITHSHYDGFAALVQAKPGEPEPVLTLTTAFTTKNIPFHELAHLNGLKLVDNFGNQFQISSYFLPSVGTDCNPDGALIEDPIHEFPDEEEQVLEDQTPPSAEPTPKPMLATELSPKTPGAPQAPLQTLPEPSATPSAQPSPKSSEPPKPLVSALPGVEPSAKPTEAPKSSAAPVAEPAPAATQAP